MLWDLANDFHAGPMRVLILLFSIVSMFDAVAEEGWSIDYRASSDVVDVLASANQRHPGFLRSAVRYRADLGQLFARAGRLREYLKSGTERAGEIKPSPIRRIDVAGGPELSYDSESVARLRAKLRELRNELGGERTNLVADLARTANPRALLQLAPLLYDETGHATDPVDIQSVEPGVLETLYFDLWPEHLLPLIADKPLALEVQEGFIGQIVRPALAKHETGEVAPASAVYLEEVPKPFALLRGGIGFDCSMSTVPLYVLLDSVRVFWIRKSANPKEHPRGYVLLAEVDLDGRKVPYVITVNGSTLSAREGRAAVLLATQGYAGDEILAPTDAVKHIVNRPEMREAVFQSTKRGRPVAIEMPAGWSEVDKVSKEYYRTDVLKRAKLITLTEDEEAQRASTAATSRVGYYPRVGANKLKAFDRALLFVEIVPVDQVQTDLQETFELTSRQIELAYRLREIGDDKLYFWLEIPELKRLTASELDAFETEFEMRMVDLFRVWGPRKTIEQLVAMTDEERATRLTPAELHDQITSARRFLLSELESSPEDSLESKASLLYALPRTSPDDNVVENLSRKRWRRSRLAAAIDGTERILKRPDIYVRHLTEYGPEQPLWMRLLAVEAWSAARNDKAAAWYRQLEIFVKDPDARVRAKALGKAHYASRNASIHYFKAMHLGAQDSDPRVRREVAMCLRETEQPYHAWLWPSVERLLDDADPDTRREMAYGLHHQAAWPAAVWRRFPGLIADRGTRFGALTGVSGKTWPQEIWNAVNATFTEIDASDYLYGKAEHALWSQNKWTHETVAALQAFRQTHPDPLQKMGGHYDPARVVQLVKQRARDAFPLSEAPMIAEDTCAKLLVGRRDPMWERVAEKVFDAFETVGRWYDRAKGR